MKITLKQLLSILLEIFFLFIILLIEYGFSESNREFHIKLAAVLAFFILITTLFIIYINRKRFDCYSILLVVIFIFMFGQHWLYLCGIKPNELTIVSSRLSNYAVFHTSFLVLKSIVILNIGYLLNGRNPYQIRQQRSKEFINNNRKILFKTGLIFFSISIIPTLFDLGQKIYLTFTVGYGERMLNEAYRVSGIQNITGVLAGFMLPSLLVLFISRKKENNWPVVAIAMYMVLYTASGSRISTMILLLGILYIQINLFSRINWKIMIKYGVLLSMVLMIFNVVSLARNDINKDNDIAETIKASFNNIIENNIIVLALEEAGYTFSATATVIDNCPSLVDFNYGKSYLSGLAYILPNGMTDNYYAKVGSTDDTFKGYLNSYGSGIGSSFIAEAYWNFGEYSLILIFLFGLILGQISKSLDDAIYRLDYKAIFIFTYIFVIISFYVRSDTRTFFRNYFWYCLPIILVFYFIKVRQKNRKKLREL